MVLGQFAPGSARELKNQRIGMERNAMKARRGPERAGYSIGMPDALITFAHFAISLRT